MDQPPRLLSRLHLCGPKEGILEYWSPNGSSNARYQFNGHRSQLPRRGLARPGSERESGFLKVRTRINRSFPRTSVLSLPQYTYTPPAISQPLPHQSSPFAAGSTLKKASLHVTAPTGQAHLSYRTSTELKTVLHLSNISEM